MSYPNPTCVSIFTCHRIDRFPIWNVGYSSILVYHILQHAQHFCSTWMTGVILSGLPGSPILTQTWFYLFLDFSLPEGEPDWGLHWWHSWCVRPLERPLIHLEERQVGRPRHHPLRQSSQQLISIFWAGNTQAVCATLFSAVLLAEFSACVF